MGGIDFTKRMSLCAVLACKHVGIAVGDSVSYWGHTPSFAKVVAVWDTALLVEDLRRPGKPEYVPMYKVYTVKKPDTTEYELRDIKKANDFFGVFAA